MDDLIRSRMHEALGVEAPDPGLRARVMSSLPVRERPARRIRLSSLQWTSGVVAALLALAVIAGLVYSRYNSELQGPAHTGSIGQGIVPNRVPFQCSLPVVVGLYPSVFIQIQLPSGVMVNESIQPDNFNGQSSYDVQAGKWVPVPSSAVSLDGRSYAYGLGITEGGGSNGTVHVIDVVTGQDRKVWAGAGGAQVLGYLSSGVYFLEQLGGSGPAVLWVVDPARPSAARRIGPMPNSWGGRLVGPVGMFAIGNDSAGQPNRVDHMDLATGSVSTWFVNPTVPNTMHLLALDGQGYPVVATDSSRVLVITGVNQSVVIADGSNVSFQPETAFGDGHGVWFGEPGSVWLYDRAAGLRKVFGMPVTQFPTPSPGPGKFIPSPLPGEPTAPPTPPGTPSGVTLSVFGPCR
jgi:hypothetical protein